MSSHGSALSLGIASLQSQDECKSPVSVERSESIKSDDKITPPPRKFNEEKSASGKVKHRIVDRTQPEFEINVDEFTPIHLKKEVDPEFVKGLFPLLIPYDRF